MKTLINFFLISVLLFAGSTISSQTVNGYYLNGGEQYNKEIPSPADFFGFNPGEWHVSHDQLVSYFTMLSQKSGRVKYEVYGRTHEGRPLTYAIISSEENIRKIEEIRQQHLKITDPAVSSSIDLSTQPVIVWLSHSIHGNEQSGSNSSMITAWHFAAGTGKEIDDILKSTVILIDPSTNPDGMQRFSTWVNSHKSYMVNTDPLSREHIEVWPGGRSNHYWFDLNRDWLPLEQPESFFRVKKLLDWKPNVLVDLHEMGSNSTFHFSPGEPKRVNPLIPDANQELTKRLAEGYAKAFDGIGSLYFSQEQFDDFYIGRGPTFLDMNGGVSLLFEQASARGYAQNTDNGLLTFPFAIKNQLTGALSSVSTAFRLRNEFLSYQRNYYQSALSEAAKNPKKAYVFGTGKDKNMTYQLARLLNSHGINSFLLKKNTTIGKKSFEAGNAYIVPLDQQQYRLIESIFEIRTTFRDSIFYDVSSWNIPMAYNLPFEALDAKLNTSDLRGEKFSESMKPSGKIISNGNAYAYALKWTDYNAPAALYSLLAKNIIVKVATSPIEMQSGEVLDRGTLIIPLGTINSNREAVEKSLQEATTRFGLEAFALNTGDNSKFDLGSPTLINVDKPRILILTEEGVNGFSSGQLWHLFDTRYEIPITLLPMRQLSGVNLYNYNILIFPDGNYQAVETRTVEKIQEWIAAGNTLIGLERATQWFPRVKLTSTEFRQPQGENLATSYENSLLWLASREVAGTIFEATVDLSHPLFFGFTSDKFPVYKDNSIIQNAGTLNALNYPARYSSSPLLAGYSPKGFDKTISGTPTCAVYQYRTGRVIASYNNPVFRGYWRGQNRFLANAIFFGKAIRFSAGGDQ